MRTPRFKIGVMLPMVAAVWLAGSARAWADTVQPIVSTGGVLYGSAQHTMVSSNTFLYVDTQTIRLNALKGVRVSTVTFLDGSFLASSATIQANSIPWGNITGTLSNQTDLQTTFLAVGTSTASLKTNINAIGVSTGSLQTQMTAVGVSTGVIASSVAALGVSTGTLGTTVAAHTASIASIGLSTASLQTQLNLVGVSTAALSVSTASLQAQLNAVPVLSSANVWTGTATWTTPATSTFSYGVAVGSMVVNDLFVSSFVITDANKKLVSLDLYGRNNSWTNANSFTSSAGNAFVYGVTIGSAILTGLPGTGPLRGGSAIVISTGATSLTSEVSGVLPVANGGTGTATPNLVAGTQVTISGTWPNQTINALTGGASALAVTTGSSAGFASIASSPTAVINFEATQFNAALKGGATGYVSLNQSSVTLQGNSFNIANRLVQLSAGGQLPAVDGNQLTNLNGSAILAGNIPAIALSTAVLIQSSLQVGSTFYVSSGTAINFNTTNLKFADGTTQTTASLLPANVILNQNTLQAGTTAYPASLYVGSNATIYGPFSVNNALTVSSFGYVNLISSNPYGGIGSTDIGSVNQTMNYYTPGSDICFRHNLLNILDGQDASTKGSWYYYFNGGGASCSAPGKPKGYYLTSDAGVDLWSLSTYLSGGAQWTMYVPAPGGISNSFGITSGTGSFITSLTSLTNTLLGNTTIQIGSSSPNYSDKTIDFQGLFSFAGPQTMDVAQIKYKHLGVNGGSGAPYGDMELYSSELNGPTLHRMVKLTATQASASCPVSNANGHHVYMGDTNNGSRSCPVPINLDFVTSAATVTITYDLTQLVISTGINAPVASLTAFNTTATSATVTGTGGLSNTFGIKTATFTATAFNITTTSATATGSGGLLVLSTATFVSPAQMPSFNVATINLTTPIAVGQFAYVSDATALTMCVSTGTAVGAWASPTSKTTACR